MKKAVIALGCLTIFASGWAFGSSQGSSFGKGTDWKVLGRVGKVMYVGGYLSGFIRAENDMVAVAYGAGTKGGQRFAPTPSESQEAATVVARIKQEDWPLLTRYAGTPTPTTGQIVVTMDTFYSNYRNAPVCWHDALMFSAASLAGRPPTERVLNNARIAGAEKPCGM